jgi:hypothetical protein
MVAHRLRKLVFLAPPLVALLVGAALGLLLRPGASTTPAPAAMAGTDPETVSRAILLSVREQGRQTVFAARFVAISTASQSRLGLTARKTLIMPGEVRYSVDLARLRRENLAWDAATRTLTVTLPPLEIAGPRIDLNQVQEYSEGGIAMALTGGEGALDETNRRAGQVELMRQAREPGAMGQARDAAMRAAARSFAMPLRASGIDASVAVRFVGPSGAEQASFLDRPWRIEDRIRAKTQ